MPDGAIAIGEVIEAVEHKRLVFTWGWLNGWPVDVQPGTSTVEITLEAEPPESTRILLTHNGLPDTIAHHRSGWIKCLGNLAEASENPPMT